jgi:16S rRNA (guanine966-N2)-methyltransferase
MRVITGSARGLVLSAPKGGARPTMDRVRAAIFSSLGDAVPGARVLDLFAGSGALGIEALSRGAASAVFVDSSRESARCIRRNLAKAGLEGSVQTMDAFRFLELYAGEASCDLIFADPPYAENTGARLAGDAFLARALAPGGTFVLECAEEGGVPEPGAGLRVLGTRRYGGTSIACYVAA